MLRRFDDHLVSPHAVHFAVNASNLLVLRRPARHESGELIGNDPDRPRRFAALWKNENVRGSQSLVSRTKRTGPIRALCFKRRAALHEVVGTLRPFGGEDHPFLGCRILSECGQCYSPLRARPSSPMAGASIRRASLADRQMPNPWRISPVPSHTSSF